MCGQISCPRTWNRRIVFGVAPKEKALRNLAEDTLGELLQRAQEVRERAHAPYSKYRVGAALLAEDDRVFVGANVENSAYPTSLCAERSAVGQAIAAGARRFRAIVVVGGKGSQGGYPWPCGNCRQTLAEFGSELVVVSALPTGEHKRASLATLLPYAFSL